MNTLRFGLEIFADTETASFSVTVNEVEKQYTVPYHITNVVEDFPVNTEHNVLKIKLIKGKIKINQMRFHSANVYADFKSLYNPIDREYVFEFDNAYLMARLLV